MALSVSARLAIRNLGRQKRRTAISVVGIGLGVSFALIMMGLTNGKAEMFIRGAAETGVGHFKVIPPGFLQSRDDDLRLTDWQKRLETVRKTPGVKVATPRARAQTLLGMGTRVTAVVVTGVDPLTEPLAQRYVRKVAQGRYLQPGDTGLIVLGKKVASRLDVVLDDDIVATVSSSQGDIQRAMFRLVGIVETGNSEIDATVAQVNLPDMEQLTGLSGPGELTVLVNEYTELEAVRSRVTQALGSGVEVPDWLTMMPEMRAMVSLTDKYNIMTGGILVLMVMLGIVSAQLTAVLERRREYGVLLALGAPVSHLTRTIVAEAVVLGVLGALFSLIPAVPCLWYLATKGLDVTLFYSEIPAVSGVMMDPVMHAVFTPWAVAQAFILSLSSTLLATLYPASFARRTDPAEAMRVGQ